MKRTANRHFRIFEEIRDFIIPLSGHEILALERNILEQGCRDPIVVWKKNKVEIIIIDGHHRYEICIKHDIPFGFKALPFSDIEDVKLWMIENQMGRRNLNHQQLSYYRGLKYLSLRKKKGGFANVKSKGNIEDPTSEVLSKEFNVSASTIKRDSTFAESLNYIGRLDAFVKLHILNGTVKVTKSQMRELIKDPDENKVNRYLAGIRTSLENKSRPAKFAAGEPRDGLIRIKGMVMGTIARLVKERRKEDLYELKVLIGKLEAELFERSATNNNYHHELHNTLKNKGNAPQMV